MTDPTPTISVILPVYNVADHVAACIDSLRAQTFAAFEVIVVDDGSTDASLTLARAAAAGDDRFRFFERANGGLSAARNTGLARARGAFIAFVDSDDRVAPGFLARLHTALTDSGADWVACAIRIDYADGGQVLHSAIHGSAAFDPSSDPVAYAFDDWTDVLCHFPSAWNKLYRRSLIEGLLFDEGTYYEDHAFFWRAAARTDRLIRLPEPLYWHTQGRKGQITREDSDRVFDQFAVLDQLRDIVAESDRPGGRLALARIATRLVQERSLVIADPDRRIRFAEAARDWFAREGLTYTADWDDSISRTWGVVLAGQLPLTVVVPTDGNTDLLSRTLDSLAGQVLRDLEILVVPDTEAPQALSAVHEAAARSLPAARILDGRHEGPAAARNRGLAEAQGVFVVFLDAGDRLRPGALAGWVEGMVRHGANFGASRFAMAGSDRIHNGFHDVTGLGQALVYGPFDYGPLAALCLHAHPSAKIFRRDFLVRNALRFPPEPLSAWQFVLAAALAAGPSGLYFDGAGVEIGMEAAARQLWRDPVPADQIIAALNAASTAMAPEVRDSLPKGWLRRLFARAIWEKAHFASIPAAEKRGYLAAAAAVAAEWFAGQDGALDPYIDPQVRMILAGTVPDDLPADAPPPPPAAPRRPPARDEVDCALPAKPVISRPQHVQPTTENSMHAFRTLGGASLSYDVEFSAHDYANISFFDRTRDAILFHLSLRQRTSLAACNRRTGETWEGERAHPVSLDADLNRITITFGEAGGVVVQLNDQAVFSYDAEYPDLDLIECFNFQGGLVPETFELTGDANPARVGMGDGRLILPMTVDGWAYDPDSDKQKIDVTLPGLNEPLPALVSKRPDIAREIGAETEMVGYSVALPGRVWLTLSLEDEETPDEVAQAAATAAARAQARPTATAAIARTGLGLSRTAKAAAVKAARAEPTLLVQPRCNGIPCGAVVEVRRSDVINQIEKLAASPDAERGLQAQLLAIEHARFARLMPRLSLRAQEMLTNAATTFQVLDFLLPPEDESEDPASAPAATGDTAPRKAALAKSDAATKAPGARQTGAKPAVEQLRSVDPVQLQKNQLLDTFVETMRRAPETDPGALLAELLGGPFRASPEVRRALYLSLVDFFCTRDEFSTLHARAAVEQLAVFQQTNQAWHDSAILPFLLMENRIEEIRQILWRLVNDENGWLVTSAIARVVRALIVESSEPVSEKTREEVLYAFIALIDQRAADYWARTPCVQLIATAVELVVHADRFADYMQRDILTFVLRSYGLSREFWRQIDVATKAGELVPSLRLTAAQTAFRQIEARIETGEGQVEPALRFFELIKCADVERLRIEVLGPAGVEVPPGGSIVEAAFNQGRDLGEAILRCLAAPANELSTPVTADLSHEVRLAMTDRFETLSKAPFHSLQLQTTARLRAVLSGIASGRISGDAVPAELAALTPHFTNLARARSRFIGLRMEIGTIATLIRQGDRKNADILLRHLLGIVGGLTRDETAQLANSPALVGALYGIRRLEAETGSDLAAAILALFPQVVAALPEDPAPSDQADPAWAKADPLFDTIVTVFSCQPNLDTRVAAMRQGWLSLLADFGIPYIIVVGGGDGSRDGDVVHLDAADDYEGLPQKTLATIQWVHDHTPFAHMLKIDDDCYLNVAEYFHSLSYAKFDYHGRPLTRSWGQLDRSWHFAKSTSARGRMELDKSPEPSTYADGGSGYALSRTAMARILQRAETPEGQFLIRSSFMEDKMVGDLLAETGIRVSDEDYYVAVMRRSHSHAIPVSMFANAFQPGLSSVTKLIHLDAVAPQETVFQARNDAALLPKKIWPSFARTKLVEDTNAVELVSSETRLKKVNKAPVAIVACMRNEMFMLPHFLAHYRAMGVEGFLIADNLSDDGTLEYLAGQPDVAVFSVDTSYRTSRYGVAWQQALLAHFRLDRWTLVADADELLVCDLDRKTRLPDLLAQPDFVSAEAVRLFMLDMYPEGPLSAATLASGDPFAEIGFVDAEPFRTNSAGLGAYSNGVTWTSALRHRLIPGSRPELFVAQKIALLKYKPWMRLSAGLHYVADARVAERELIFAHFKYHSEFRAKAQAEVARRQHFNDAEEYRKYLALMSEGRDRIFDPALSVRWQDCAFLRERLGLPVTG